MRLHEYYFENLGGKGQINKGARVGVVVCETCINGRVLTPFGRDVLALVTSGHVKELQA